MSDFLKICVLIWQVIWNWWWLPVPFFLFGKLKKLYFFWIRWEFWFSKFRSSIIVLEIIPPKNLAKTFKTMEDVFGALWGPFYTPPNWREEWLEGFPKGYGGPAWFALEIASIAGNIHFYARLPKGMKNHFEATIYSQYPDAEISVAEDYTKNVPDDAPNDEWDIRGEDSQLLREDIYPIKTYDRFFEPQMGKINEERLVDPIHSLMESLSQIKSGDQVWIQMGLVPIVPGDLPNYESDSKQVMNKLAKRPGVPKDPGAIKRNADILFDPEPWKADTTLLLSGLETKPVEKKKEDLPKELLLSPGERDILSDVEAKYAKRSFLTWIRTVYIFQKNLPHDTGAFGIARNYLQHFQGLNGFRFWTKTRTKIHYILRRRRLYLKKRRIFKNYKTMFPPIPAFNTIVKKTGLFVLNIEELATIFHFPNQLDAPRVYQVGSKKGEPPLNLPIEA